MRRVLRPLSNPRVAWSIAAVFFLRLAVINLITTQRPDGRNFLTGGSRFISNPGALYAGIFQYVNQFHYQPHEAFLSPAPLALLAAPFSLLPAPLDIIGWTLADCAALFLALLILDRSLGMRGAMRAWFWIVALYFPPVFAETSASQISGFILLLSVVAMVGCAAQPALAGMASGAATALKIYPAALVLGAGRQRGKFVAGFGLGLATLSTLGFMRPGVINPIEYLRTVLLPVVHYPPYHDCAVVSVPSFWLRLLGGVFYYDGITTPTTTVTLFSAPGLATALNDLTLIGLVGAALWSARRAAWEPKFSLAVMLALGALIPGDVHPYQVLPLLPLVLITLVGAMRRNHRPVLMAMAVALLGLLEQPCALAFPNVWTLATTGLFAMCVIFGPTLLPETPSVAEGRTDT